MWVTKGQSGRMIFNTIPATQMMGKARGGEEEDKALALRCMILQFRFELIMMACERLALYMCASN